MGNVNTVTKKQRLAKVSLLTPHGERERCAYPVQRDGIWTPNPSWGT